MLKEVGKSGSAELLVLGAHVVPDVNRHHWYGVVFVEDYVEAVGQSDFIKGYRNH
jgi:hypothetical protein